MNEFTAKKLGEVLAFAEVGLETLEKGKAALESALTEEKVGEVVGVLRSHKDLIHTIADRAHVLEAVLGKLETTGEKLRQMRDLYIGSGWENPTELLEWSGFFEGAAVVHISLLQGAAEEMGHSELKAFANESLFFHKDLLDTATSLLHLIGRKKASS